MSAADDPLRDAVRKRRAAKLRQVDAGQASGEIARQDSGRREGVASPDTLPTTLATPRVSAGTGTGQAAVAADIDPLRAAVARAVARTRLPL